MIIGSDLVFSLIFIIFFFTLVTLNKPQDQASRSGVHVRPHLNSDSPFGFRAFYYIIPAFFFKPILAIFFLSFFFVPLSVFFSSFLLSFIKKTYLTLALPF